MGQFSKEEIKNECKRILRRVGISNSEIIVDFGCGKGNYTLAAAELVGKEGKIISIDSDEFKLKELFRIIKDNQIKNVKLLNNQGRVKIPVPESSADFLLFYDIFWYFTLQQQKDLFILLTEAKRILANTGILSVYPEHIDIENLIDIIEKHGFILIRSYSESMIHEDQLVKGQIFNFKKDTSF
jgi:ubiquinone/menaquinone biosynthesis C-methylase UbiE